MLASELWLDGALYAGELPLCAKEYGHAQEERIRQNFIINIDGSSHKAKQNHLKSVISLFWQKLSI